MPLSGREKATILLSMLGAEASAKILRYLPGELADLIAAGVEHLPIPSPEALAVILDDFNRYVALPPANFEVTYPAETFVEEKTITPKDPKAVLLTAHPKKIALSLLHERPQIIAFVVSQLSALAAADVLAYLPDQRRDVENLLKDIKRIPLSPKIEANLLETLAKKIGN